MEIIRLTKDKEQTFKNIQMVSVLFKVRISQPFAFYLVVSLAKIRISDSTVPKTFLIPLSIVLTHREFIIFFAYLIKSHSKKYFLMSSYFIDF